jgi:hypothetical protein
VLEVFPVGATSEQTCADFHFDPLQSTSVHFEPYSRSSAETHDHTRTVM